MRFAYALLSVVLATWPARAADLPELVLPRGVGVNTHFVQVTLAPPRWSAVALGGRRRPGRITQEVLDLAWLGYFGTEREGTLATTDAQSTMDA